MRTLSFHEAWREIEHLRAIEQELEQGTASERRGRRFFFGRMFAPQFEVSAQEIVHAMRSADAQLPHGWRKRPELADDAARLIASELATDERREQLRRAAAGLANALAPSMPLLAEALREAATAPAPADPADDLLWVQLVIGLMYDRLG